MPIARRFAFTETLKSGRQRLVQAELDVGFRFLPRTARVIREIGQVPGEQPDDGSVPQVYHLIRPSRSNTYFAAVAGETGFDFVDINIGVYHQITGAGPNFNEHYFSDTSRSNCPSPVFEAFVASELASGVPADQVAAYDYSVMVEGANIGWPELVWTEEETLLVRFELEVILNNGGGGFSLGFDYFEFEIDPTVEYPLKILSRNGDRRPKTLPPVNHFGLIPASGGGKRIAFHKLPLPIAWGMVRYLPWLQVLPWVTRYQKADHVAGYAQ